MSATFSLSEDRGARPISEVIAIRPSSGSISTDYLFLKVPLNYVNHCIEGKDGGGEIETRVSIHAKRNRASLGQQKVIGNADGKYVSADGEPLITLDSTNCSVFKGLRFFI